MIVYSFQCKTNEDKFVCIKSSLQIMHNLYLLVEIQSYLKILLIEFCETSHNRRQAPKV